ncbi:oxidoreductase [Acrocarpospora corrugata]|uniref:Oxidoreductase n=1 Tax=Acrocarpospora corrugata TaxID=35763 RepID=A0A5M3W8Q7_9ACTN|nr:Gfo/Idh/MocA family oxidoreductase [Acrocarpospora corrugata]GES05216.1 oxidoreductase [Acrocarpospora corrugata]
MVKPVNVGIVGCGAISAAYTTTIARLAGLRLTAVADLDAARARATAEANGTRALSVAELLADPDVDIVLNLTIPAAHADVALAAIAAGKDVYGEKPLATTKAEALQVLQAADTAGARLGCAPDTVLGTGVQTARWYVDNGLIGRPVAATAIMNHPGHERWHPNPDFYYTPGGGPLFDMGPYYITALITLLGPVSKVIGAASRTRSERTIVTGPRAGTTVPVTTDSHVTGILIHDSGALSTLVMSFDSAATRAPNIELHGEQATLHLPDPNHFDGEIHAHPVGGTWTSLPTRAGYQDAARGYGLADLTTTPPTQLPRTSAALALHVLDIMESLLTSTTTGQATALTTTCDRPPPVPLGPLEPRTE